MIDEWESREDQAQCFELLPENEAVADLFLACSSQWRIAGMGTPIGLDYAGLRAALSMMRVRPTPELFEQIQDMETGALKAFADMRK